jgi:hypothetical protein
MFWLLLLLVFLLPAASLATAAAGCAACCLLLGWPVAVPAMCWLLLLLTGCVHPHCKNKRQQTAVVQ